MGISWISFNISALLIIILLISLWHHFKFLQEYQKIKQKAKAKKDEENLELEEFIQDHQGYQVLFEDLKDDSLKHQAFLLIFTIYDLLCKIIYTTLFKHPLVQTILFFLLNSLQVLYLCLWKPFNNSFEAFQQLLYLVLTLGVYICVLIMAILDVQVKQATDTRIYLGKMVIVFTLTFLFSSLIFMASKLISIALNVVKSIAKKLRKPRVHPDGFSIPHGNLTKPKIQDNSFFTNSSERNTSLLSLNRQKHQNITEIDNSEIQSGTDHSEITSVNGSSFPKRLFHPVLPPMKEIHQSPRDLLSFKNLVSKNYLVRPHNSKKKIIIPSSPAFKD